MNTPRIPEAFRSMTGLGPPQAYFPIRSLNRWGGLAGVLALLLAGVVTFGYGAYQAYVYTLRYGPALIDDKLAVPSLIALALFLLAILLAWSVFASWNKGVLACELGIVTRDRKGLQAWRWEQVARLYEAVTRHYTNGIYTGTTHVYTLVDRQEKRLVLNDAYTHVEDLGKLIDQKTLPLLYERASTQYNAGESVAFGPVALGKAGITIGKKTYQWSEVQQVSIRRGILRIAKKDGGWFSGASAAVAVIPNLRVLLSMIDQIVGIKTA